MKKPWDIEPGTNATIRFLKQESDSSFIYFKIHPVEVPAADVVNLIEEYDEEIYGRATGRTRMRLRPEVKAWCIENLHGGHHGGDEFRSAYLRPTKVDNGMLYRVEFQSENDALLFKLRWIGACTGFE